MIWLGLTGGIATGKSTAAEIFRKFGESVINADEVAHQVVRPGSDGLAQVIQVFGPGLLLPDQSLDRKKMAKLVFQNPDQLRKLESILHPLVKSVVASQKLAEEKKGTKLLIYDVPLLFEKNMQDQFDSTILIACSEKLQRDRLIHRDHLTDAEVDARLQNQMPTAKKRKLAEFVIENETTQTELEQHLKQVLAKIKKRC